jgi:hypothetical protein
MKRQEYVKFTFNVGKCDKNIWWITQKYGNIKINHTIPSANELKRHTYCKWHNSFSHATNDCNVFWRQIQVAINEGQLNFLEMQVHTKPFPINMINFYGKKSRFNPTQPIRARARRSLSAMHERPMKMLKSLVRKWCGKVLMIGPVDLTNQWNSVVFPRPRWWCELTQAIYPGSGYEGPYFPQRRDEAYITRTKVLTVGVTSTAREGRTPSP